MPLLLPLDPEQQKVQTPWFSIWGKQYVAIQRAKVLEHIFFYTSHVILVKLNSEILAPEP